jgi:hypothetical protein
MNRSVQSQLPFGSRVDALGSMVFAAGRFDPIHCATAAAVLVSAAPSRFCLGRYVRRAPIL